METQKIQIGGREVVFTASLIIPPEEDAWVEFSLSDWRIKMNLVFKTEIVEEGKPAPSTNIAFEPKEDYAVITFLNWDRNLGLASDAPIEIGTLDNGQKLYVMIWHWRAGTIRHLDMQFSLGAKP